MQTPVESLIEALLPYIDRSRISDTALQDCVEQHIAQQKEQLAKEYLRGYSDAKTFNRLMQENFTPEREQALRDMMQRDEDSGLYDADPDWPWERDEL